MADHQAPWPVAVQCEVLEVSRSGLYDSVARHTQATIDAEEITLVARVRAISAQARESYGSRRMAKALQAEGCAVGRAQARRLMQDAGVSVKRRSTRTPQTTDSRHGYGVALNIVDREFGVATPHTVWAGDLTYLWTREGWLSGAVLLDLYSRKVVGWSLGSRMDVGLVQGAREMAIGRRQPEPGFIHHTDRGSPYACHEYRDLLKTHGLVCSMSGTGECLDNAVAERFFGSLKQEWTSHRDDETRQEARDDIIAYIEMFYNSHRKHSYLGYLSPNEYEKFDLVASKSVRFDLTTTLACTTPEVVLRSS
jgi:transposase InsO family protein